MTDPVATLAFPREMSHIRGCPPALVAVAVLAAVCARPRAARAERELSIVPIAGGDSDVGIGIGEVSAWASLDPAFKQSSAPYRWRLETDAFVTFKLREGNDVINPFQDYFVLLTLPRTGPGGRLRLDVRPAYTDERTLKYYGIGNATPFPDGVPIADTEYERVHPTLLVEGRMQLAPGWFAQLGNVYTHNWLKVPPTSLLAMQQAAGAPDVRAMLGSFDSHGVDLIELGLQLDTRDDETVTRHGQFHAVQARLSPAVPGWMPYAYQQLDVTLRFYTTPIPRWLTVSFRLVGDVLLGDPPFYELARFAETPAIGGGKAVRGVPAQRYYGKVKLFENLEVQSELVRFTIKGKPMALAAAAFLDAGRVWAELGRRHPELDGTGWGIKYGVGGGLRLQRGQTFVVRADVAWSPDARPIGGYFAAGNIF